MRTTITWDKPDGKMHGAPWCVMRIRKISIWAILDFLIQIKLHREIGSHIAQNSSWWITWNGLFPLRGLRIFIFEIRFGRLHYGSSLNWVQKVVGNEKSRHTVYCQIPGHPSLTKCHSSVYNNIPGKQSFIDKDRMVWYSQHTLSRSRLFYCKLGRNVNNVVFATRFQWISYQITMNFPLQIQSIHVHITHSVNQWWKWKQSPYFFMDNLYFITLEMSWSNQ